MNSEKLKQIIAELLTDYEFDEPHISSPDCDVGNENEQSYNGASYKQLIEWSQMEHHGDCIDFPCTCMKCVADSTLHKANWLTKQLIKNRIAFEK